MQPSEGRISKPQGQAACLPCKRRKSRCKFESGQQACLMCRAYDTECIAVPAVVSRPRPPSTSVARNRTRAKTDLPRERRSSNTGHTTPDAVTQQRVLHVPGTPVQNRFNESHSALGSLATPFLISSIALNREPPGATQPMSLDEADDDNPHIIGPAIASDRHFLEDYLSSIQTDSRSRTIRPVLPGSTSAPVVFTRVQKRPLGVAMDSNPSCVKLQTIEKLLEPWQHQIVNMYFANANSCFPILDESDFKDRYTTASSRISPAVLSCLYAHSLIYWRHDAELSRQRHPDGRFIWNLALEALYSELHLSPGMPSILAILLNVGGRPTTTMIGNGMLLGCAISLAHCLGLNRNPIPWDIPEPEKNLRMQIWWCLVIHDRWSSFMYGTPPHISQAHHDVPLPNRSNGFENDALQDERIKVFEALASLTEALGSYIEQLYSIRKRPQGRHERTVSSLDLNAWTDSLSGEVRKVIIRGTNLEVPGSANLRLCFLAASFFSSRVELDAEMQAPRPGQPPDPRLLPVRRIAEEIVLCVHELTKKQLGHFWLPTSAFVFSSTAAFLVRLAVQSEIPTTGSAESLSLSLAKDLVASLRSHKEIHGWELGDICLAQYGGVVDKLSTQQNLEMDCRWLNSIPPFVPDTAFMDSIIADPWDASLWGHVAGAQ